MGKNLAYNAQVGIATKTFIAPLSSYTQSNCQVTLTDSGYRIYRPPNLTQSANGNTMWGGLVLRYPNPPFIKGHTYIITFKVRGQSSNGVAGEMNWSNNCGWGGGGLSPSPSNVSYSGLPTNFQSTDWYPIFYKWTINDEIYKVCTNSYSSFVQGNTYPSYRDFKFGFGYTSTGELGTDIYINNIGLYDITDGQKISLTKTGQLKVNDTIEENINKASFMNSTNINLNNFYEY